MVGKSLGWLPGLAFAGVVALTGTNRAKAQVYEPAPEDWALVADLLVDRVDLSPERVVYVAPPGGADGDGSRDNPRRDLISAVRDAEAGTAIHMAPGVYDMSALRDQFGHDDSALWTDADGESGRPIVLRTDPDLYDLDAGSIAVLDFNYENDPPGWRRASFIVRHSYWVFERFEMRRMRNRGFWVHNHAWDNTFRELHLHHVDTDGTNNDAAILMRASGGETNNVILANHLHHVGVIDRTTGDVTDRGGENSGCFYTETLLTYDSTEPAAGQDASLAEWEAGVLPPDSHVYLIGNDVHHCRYGLGVKTNGRGPYFFLSNHIHDNGIGILSPFSDNVIRNNILRGDNIHIGRTGGRSVKGTFFRGVNNGARSEIAYNTVVDARLTFVGGWSSNVHHNLVIGSENPINPERSQYTWWEDGAWPGIRGEYFLEDLGPSHPLFDSMPGYMQELAGEYTRARLEDNCYDHEPVIASAGFTQAVGDVTGRVFDERYTMLTTSQREGLFNDESGGDYRRTDGDGVACGSRIGADAPLPGVDAGTETGSADGGVMEMPDMEGPDAGASGVAGDPSKMSGGCEIAAMATRKGAPVGVLLFLTGLLGLRMSRARTRWAD